MKKTIKLLVLLICTASTAYGQSSYIGRLWNTKSYEKIIEFSPKGSSLSGRDNMTVGRAFMALVPPQPAKALTHYDLAISKRMNSEDLYFFRAEAYYALGELRAALADLEKCLEFRKNHQKYMLFKASIQYEMGDLKSAYETYYAISELYDKQTPFYMLATISLEQEKYYQAREWVDENMLRFERGKDFWRMTAEQQVDTEWHIWKDYEKAQKTQDALLSYFPNDVRYLKNRLGLYRTRGLDSLGVWAENDLYVRYKNNELPLDYYKKGSIKVAEYVRNNGIVEDYLTFRPALFNNTKYVRFFLSESGNVLGKQWAGLVVSPQDSTQKMWDFHRGSDRFIVPANDTSYVGFAALFEAPDSALVSYTPVPPAMDSTVMDSVQIQAPELLNEVPTDTTNSPMQAPKMIEPKDTSAVREER